jgi:hypothetical protein
VHNTISNINDVSPLGRKAIGAGPGYSIDLLGLATPSFRNRWLPGTVAAASDVLGVAVSITVLSPTVAGSITAYATGAAKPIASTLSFAAGATVSNMALVRTDSTGHLSLSMAGLVAGTAHVTVDVMGWFSTSSYTAGTADNVDDERGSRLTTLTPKRLIDTRNGAAADTPIAAGATLTVSLATAPTPAEAVLLNITALAPTATTMLAVLPDALAAGRPAATQNMNVRVGATRSNLVIARIGTDRSVRIYNRAGNTNVSVDVVGYFTTGALETTRAGRVVPLGVPFRAFDTRLSSFGKVPLGPGQAEDWSFAAFSNSVNIGGSPVGKQTALLGNLTNASLARSVTTVPVSSSLTMYPTPASTGATPPTIANLSTVESVAVSNAAVVPFSTKQTLRVFNAKGYAHYSFDVYAVVLGD